MLKFLKGQIRPFILFFFLGFFFCLLSTCNNVESTIAYLDIPVKNRSLTNSFIKEFDIQNEILSGFSTPQLTEEVDGLLSLKYVAMKGTNVQLGNDAFKVTVVDYNQNNTFEDDDEVYITTLENDSIVTLGYPTMIKGFGKFYLKTSYGFYRIRIELEKSRVVVDLVSDKSEIDQMLVYNNKLPDVRVLRIAEKDTILLSSLIPDYGRIKAHISSLYCKGCVQKLNQLNNKVPSKKLLEFTDVLIYPPNEPIDKIIEFNERYLDQNYHPTFQLLNESMFKDLNVISLPHTAYYDQIGILIKNHESQ